MHQAERARRTADDRDPSAPARQPQYRGREIPAPEGGFANFFSPPTSPVTH